MGTKKIVIFIAVLLSVLQGYTQIPTSLTAFEYSEKYKRGGGWTQVTNHYGKVEFRFNENSNEIVVYEELTSQTLKFYITMDTVEDSDRVLYANCGGLEYKFVFPFKDNKCLIVYTIERSGEILEAIIYKLV